MSVYVYTTLDDPSAAGSTVALGVNAAGQVVGYYVDNSNHDHGFLYSGGSYTTIDDPNATNGTFAYGINSAGQVVGRYFTNVVHGFLFSGGAYTTLDAPSAGGGTSIFGINDLGQIAGGYISGSGDHGFVYISNLGLFVTLPEPAARLPRMASAMPA